MFSFQEKKPTKADSECLPIVIVLKNTSSRAVWENQKVKQYLLLL